MNKEEKKHLLERVEKLEREVKELRARELWYMYPPPGQTQQPYATVRW